MGEDIDFSRWSLVMKKGQSIIEYAILVSAVAVVFVTMYYFIQQGMKSKLLSIETEVNDAVRSH
jgi:Flp pilus assembly pilin Flp